MFGCCNKDGQCPCGIRNMSASRAQMFAAALTLIGIGEFVCHFYAKVPVSKIAPIMGENPTADQQTGFWVLIGLMTVVNAVFAMMPTNRSAAGFLSVVNVCLTLPMIGRTACLVWTHGCKMNKCCALMTANVIFSVFLTCTTYNYWVALCDKAGAGGAGSASRSVSRASSMATTSASPSPKKKAAATKRAPSKKKGGKKK